MFERLKHAVSIRYFSEDNFIVMISAIINSDISHETLNKILPQEWSENWELAAYKNRKLSKFLIRNTIKKTLEDCHVAHGLKRTMTLP